MSRNWDDLRKPGVMGKNPPLPRTINIYPTPIGDDVSCSDVETLDRTAVELALKVALTKNPNFLTKALAVEKGIRWKDPTKGEILILHEKSGDIAKLAALLGITVDMVKKLLGVKAGIVIPGKGEMVFKVKYHVTDKCKQPSGKIIEKHHTLVIEISDCKHADKRPDWL